MALDNGVAVRAPRLEHGARAWRRTCSSPRRCPGTELVEYLTGSPYIDAIVAEPWRLDADGMLAIPDGPGLGVALDLDRVAHYARGERLPVAR